MINVIMTIELKEGQRSKFIEIFKANIPNVLEEEGCMGYTPTVDVPTDMFIQYFDKNSVTIIQKWNSLEDLKAHLESPHMTAHRRDVETMVKKMYIKVLEEA